MYCTNLTLFWILPKLIFICKYSNGTSKISKLEIQKQRIQKDIEKHRYQITDNSSKTFLNKGYLDTNGPNCIRFRDEDCGGNSNKILRKKVPFSQCIVLKLL